MWKIQTAVSKLWKGNPDRKSRFHTGRGQLLPPANWPEIASALWHRLRPGRDPIPWMSPKSIQFLDKHIEKGWNVFEYGSGLSTAWYAHRAAQIVSVENNKNWYQTVFRDLRQTETRNVDLRLMDQNYNEFLNSILNWPDEFFDLVIVDFQERVAGDRVQALELAIPKVRLGGLLVLDDSDRPAYHFADQTGNHLAAKRFPGIKPFPLAAVETTVFERIS